MIYYYLENAEKNKTGGVCFEHNGENLYLSVEHFSHAKSESDWEKEHSHEYSHLIIYRSKGVFSINGKKHSVQSGDIFCVDGFTPHAFFTKGCPYEYYEITFSWKDKTGKRHPILFSVFMKEFFKTAESVFSENIFFHPEMEDTQKIIDAFFNLPAYCTPSFADGFFGVATEAGTLHCFFHLSNALSRIDAGGDLENRIVLAVKKFISSNYQKRFEISEVASVLSLNPRYVQTVFKKSTGKTIVEYTNKMRVESAKQMLSKASYSVRETARMLGFSDEYYFSRLFKKVEGKPPSSFIEKN